MKNQKQKSKYLDLIVSKDNLISHGCQIQLNHRIHR